MAKGKFGADKYRPHQLGPEPSAPSETAPPPVVAAAPAPVVEPVAPPPPPVARKAAAAPAPRPPAPAEDAMRDIKVQFSSRVSYAADQQLKGMAKQGHSQTKLLAEALNMLFKKYGLDEVA